MPLYRVTIDMDLLVVAQDAAAAKWVARENLSRADGERDTAFDHADVAEVSELDANDADALPWGGDGMRCCADYLAEQQAAATPAVVDPRRVKLFEDDQ